MQCEQIIEIYIRFYFLPVNRIDASCLCERAFMVLIFSLIALSHRVIASRLSERAFIISIQDETRFLHDAVNNVTLFCNRKRPNIAVSL